MIREVSLRPNLCNEDLRSGNPNDLLDRKNLPSLVVWAKLGSAWFGYSFSQLVVEKTQNHNDSPRFQLSLSLFHPLNAIIRPEVGGSFEAPKLRMSTVINNRLIQACGFCLITFGGQ